jgi:tetratricopeptide (TPR) repeat protein
MTATGVPATGRAAAENELLAELGLPPSASPEEVDRAHQVVSDYLASAPSGIRGWAHARSAALDAAYLQLTDPVGFGGSALRSPTRPPRVDPGGPATPPARREVLPPAPSAPDAVDETDVATEDDDAFEALYASVTPSAHSDMGPDRKRKVRSAQPERVADVTAPAADGGIWKKAVIGLAGVAIAAVLLFVGYNLNGGGAVTSPGTPSPDTAAASAPVVDQAKVAALMEKIQADPSDTATMLALADEFYAGEDYASAGTWLDKLLALDPKNVDALLARGAASFNLGDLVAAKDVWDQVVALDAKNVEAHYDLGFLFLNQGTPDWDGVQREWGLVVELAPGTQLAETVQQHLDSLAASSMLPVASAPASSAAPSASAPADSASPAASTQP